MDEPDADDMLSGMFQSMGTSSHEALIAQVQSIVPGITAEIAIMSIMDQGGVGAVMHHATSPEPEAELVSDITFGEGEAVPPGAEFTKVWRIRNCGAVRWPSDIALVYQQGERMECPDYVAVAPINPGETTDVSVRLRAPGAVGHYAGAWRMSRSTGGYFSPEIWVATDGMLTALQQMNATSIGNPSTTMGMPASAPPAAITWGAAAPAAPAFGAAAAPAPAGDLFAIPNFGDSLGSVPFGQQPPFGGQGQGGMDE